MINIAAAMGLGNSPAIKSLNNIQILLNNLIKVKTLDYKQEERDRNEERLLQKRALQDFKILEDRARKQDSLKQVGLVENEDGKLLEALLMGGMVVGGLTMATSAIGGVFKGIKDFFGNVGDKVKEFLGIDGGDSDSEDSAPTATPTPATGNSNNIATSGSGKAFEHYKYLTGTLGLSDIHARGLIANAMRESSLNPKARSGDDGGPGGLFQWKGSRQTETVRKLVESGDWKGQYKYALTEDVGPQYQPKNFKTANQAANWWAKYWERPLHSHDHQKFIDQMGFQSGGKVGKSRTNMKPRFSPVTKRPPLLKLQSGGAVDIALHLIKDHEAIASLTPGERDWTRPGMSSSTGSAKKGYDKLKPDTPIYPYRDRGVKKTPTIGWGTTWLGGMMSGKNPVTMKTPPMPKKKADQHLKTDVSQLTAHLAKTLKSWSGLTTKQKAGVISIGYNAGQNAHITKDPRFKPYGDALQSGNIAQAIKPGVMPHYKSRNQRRLEEIDLLKQGPMQAKSGTRVKKQSGGFVMRNNQKKSALHNIPNMIRRKSGGMISQSQNPNLLLENQYDKGFYRRQASSVQAPTVIVLNKTRTKKSPNMDESQKSLHAGSGSDPNYYSYAKMYSNYCRAIKV